MLSIERAESCFLLLPCLHPGCVPAAERAASPSARKGARRAPGRGQIRQGTSHTCHSQPTAPEKLHKSKAVF